MFARSAVQPLTPGQMWDSIRLLVGNERERPRKGKAGRVPANARQQFIASYGIEDGADPTEYQAGIPQVLRLMNAPQMNNASLLNPILRQSKDTDEAVEKLYLTVVSRRPSAKDREMVNKFFAKSKESQREKMAGLLWALMNSSEFALNR
jgi:hypothetical protein